MRLQFLTINALSGALENPTTLQSRKLLRGMPAQKQRGERSGDFANAIF